MKFIIFDIPESDDVPVHVGDVLTFEQSARVSEINPEEHRRRSLMAAKFWDEKGIGYEVIREQGDLVWTETRGPSR